MKTLKIVTVLSLFSQLLIAQIPIGENINGWVQISNLHVDYHYSDGSPEPPILKAILTSDWPFYHPRIRTDVVYEQDTNFCNIYIKDCFYGQGWIIDFEYQQYMLGISVGEITVLNIYTDTNTVSNGGAYAMQNFYGLIKSDTIPAFYLNTETNEDIRISLYPNPATSHLNIKVNNSALIESVVIKATDGTTVLEQKETEKIPISHLAAGVYFVNVRYDNRVITKKFVKE